jgi:hypothetical protein
MVKFFKNNRDLIIIFNIVFIGVFNIQDMSITV